MYLHGNSRRNEQGHLEIGGCDTVELAAQYGTPLYVMDEQLIRQHMRELVVAFQETGLKHRIAYASKAFLSLAMARIVEEEGLMLDVVSDGELHTALQAGFPSENIYFHGNNKSPFELEFALEKEIGCFIVDNFTELEMLSSLTEQRGQSTKVLLRVSPGVEAHTHAYIQTGQEDSKFGFDLVSGQVEKAVLLAQEAPYLDFLGFHIHIGSQIFEMKAFDLAIQKMADFIRYISEKHQISIRVLNVGGGFGIRYESDDQPLTNREYLLTLAKFIKQHFTHEIPEIWVEPGRRIVGEAGTTLYTVGAIKEIPGIRKYVSVDGGMADNPRPALYQAKYEAMLANRAFEEPSEIVSIAGKACESGDMLIWDLQLPPVKTNDLLAVSCTGAYNYSMASNYNRLRRPAVVLVQNGQADVIVERESFDDLIQQDRIPNRLMKKEEVSL
ncbi:diaminopimelate decarboxylase [Risungbinella massiliensis]|uniref:diaminopimelate decarboxylase n=1 Tax=Risungbinella massiliensis TaxID=1329796 RepID=UPI0005CBBA46|nr:diaminopimelate decarboxylase [Risungbinella massiliensis]